MQLHFAFPETKVFIKVRYKLELKYAELMGPSYLYCEVRWVP